MPVAVTARVQAYLRLGRVSNLPTVWTNVLAGAVLSGIEPSAGELGLLTLGFSCLYVAGMFLNDAFDHRHDAEQGIARPITQGIVGVREVYGVGASFLVLGVVLVGLSGWIAALSAVALAALIVLYDAWHQDNPAAPALMGACRALVYITSSVAIASAVSLDVVLGSAALLSYVVGLTYASRFETMREVRQSWPLMLLFAPVLMPVSIGPLSLLVRVALIVWIALAVKLVRSREPGAIAEAVTRLIAGICVVDAVLLADEGFTWAALAALGLPLTLLMQRRVRGT